MNRKVVRAVPSDDEAAQAGMDEAAVHAVSLDGTTVHAGSLDETAVHAGSLDETAVHAVLARVLLDGRVPAGTKLGEHFLAEIFGVSRERVRKVLHRLGHERLITVEKNRGAFAIAPDLEEARSVYEARRILEGGIVGHLATALDDAGAARLAAHLAAEDAAMAAGDRFTSIRLSAEFHSILADLTGNVLIRRQMQELVARTMMLVAFFEPDSSVACQCAEHRAVFRALSGRSRAGAVRAMTTHLSLVETRLRPRACETVPPPLEEVLLDALAAWRTRTEAAARPDRVTLLDGLYQRP